MSDLISRQAAIDAIRSADGVVHYWSKQNAIKVLEELPSAQSQYEELTPEEAASEIASRSMISAWYWLYDMMRLKQMGYAICRKR